MTIDEIEMNDRKNAINSLMVGIRNEPTLMLSDGIKLMNSMQTELNTYKYANSMIDLEASILNEEVNNINGLKAFLDTMIKGGSISVKDYILLKLKLKI